MFLPAHLGAVLGAAGHHQLPKEKQGLEVLSPHGSYPAGTRSWASWQGACTATQKRLDGSARAEEARREV